MSLQRKTDINGQYLLNLNICDMWLHCSPSFWYSFLGCLVFPASSTQNLFASRQFSREESQVTSPMRISWSDWRPHWVLHRYYLLWLAFFFSADSLLCLNSCISWLLNLRWLAKISLKTEVLDVYIDNYKLGFPWYYLRFIQREEASGQGKYFTLLTSLKY